MTYIYEPQEDSLLMQECVKKFVKKDMSVLDVGTGSGILAEEAAKKAKVLAVDINPKAIQKNTKNITFKKSDLFSDIKGKFDLIIFNPPYLPEDKREPKDVALATTGGRHGYELTERFLISANNYLKKDGSILLLFSTLTKKAKIEQFIQDNLFDFKEIAKKKISFETLYVYKITKSNFLKLLEDKDISNIKRLTKGHRGLIYTGTYKKKKVAIKIQRTDIEATNTVNNEIKKLKLLNKHNIGPKLLMHGNDYFVYSFVEGEFILPALERSTKAQIRRIFKDVMEQCRQLDKLGMNKEEMHHPVKHIIVGKGITLLDFERCKHHKKVKNVTQTCQFISSGKVEHILKKKGMDIDKKELLQAARDYKKRLDTYSFDRILRLI